MEGHQGERAFCRSRSSRPRLPRRPVSTQIIRIRGKTHLWWSVFYADLSVVLPFLSFWPHLLAGFTIPLFFAGVFGAQQTQFHVHPDPEHSCGLDLHRLDHRFGLGPLGFATASRGTRTDFATWRRRKLFLQHLWKALPRWRAFLRFLRRLPANYSLAVPSLGKGLGGGRPERQSLRKINERQRGRQPGFSRALLIDCYVPARQTRNQEMEKGFWA